jgi:hypothetical protein
MPYLAGCVQQEALLGHPDGARRRSVGPRHNEPVLLIQQLAQVAWWSAGALSAGPVRRGRGQARYLPSTWRRTAQRTLPLRITARVWWPLPTKSIMKTPLCSTTQ